MTARDFSIDWMCADRLTWTWMWVFELHALHWFPCNSWHPALSSFLVKRLPLLHRKWYGLAGHRRVISFPLALARPACLSVICVQETGPRLLLFLLCELPPPLPIFTGLAQEMRPLLAGWCWALIWGGRGWSLRVWGMQYFPPLGLLPLGVTGTLW